MTSVEKKKKSHKILYDFLLISHGIPYDLSIFEY